MLLNTTEVFNFRISESLIRNSKSRQLLGTTFDINAIYQRASNKLNALARLTPYTELRMSWICDLWR